MTVLLSVVIPTYNERDNIGLLLAQLVQQLQAIAGQYEVIVVDDDSADGTAAMVQSCAEKYPGLQLLQRQGARDLSAAIAAGFGVAQGKYLLVMDADFQHEPTAVLRLYNAAATTDAALVVATRYADGGSIGDWSLLRRWLSAWATAITVRGLATSCTDPLSGFFLLRKDVWHRLHERLSLSGFKLLLEILAAAPELPLAECGYHFVARKQGKSKLGPVAGLAFLRALLRLCCKRRRQI